MKTLFSIARTASLIFALGLGLIACDGSVDVNDTATGGQPKAPQPLASFTIHFTDGSSGHTFSARGAIEDEGYVEDDPAEPGVLEPGAAVTGRRVLMGEEGLLIFAYEGLVNRIDPLEVSGTFLIVSGDGAYSGVTGTGTFDFGIDAVGDPYEIYRGRLNSP